MLKKVNYGPYCAQVSCRQLGNLEVIERFNAEYTGFHWDVSNATIAHFSPSAKTFREFEHFLHVVEYFSGQQIGAVKVTVPKGFVHPPRRAAFTANDKTTIRAHVASVTFRHEYGGSTKTMYTIVPNAPCSVAPQSVLEAIEAHYPSLPQARSIISTESGGPSSMEGELLSSRTERIVLTSVWGPFVENLGGMCRSAPSHAVANLSLQKPQSRCVILCAAPIPASPCILVILYTYPLRTRLALIHQLLTLAATFAACG